MNIIADNETYKLYNGSMLYLDKIIPENSIGSIVTDPPYELNFMNKGWDNTGIAFQKETWEKCLKVLKPGGYLLAFGGSRTFHRIACAIEDAGFEIRDTIMWLYGSGFPKSMNIGKAIEAKEKYGNSGTRAKREIELSCEGEEYIISQPNNGVMGERKEFTRKEYVPGTENAKKWDGWGTCLKPSYEPIIVARKPCEGNTTENVLKYGVGGINIDECRVGDTERVQQQAGFIRRGRSDEEVFMGVDSNKPSEPYGIVTGRFPSNVIHDGSEEAISGFPYTKSNYNDNGAHESEIHRANADNLKYGYKARIDSSSYNDEGSASRYFYTAKASKKDRDEGLDLFEGKKMYGENAQFGYGNTEDDNLGDRIANVVRKNTHVTVKPCTLMQYLVRLVTPEGETVLDPFMGSGSTGKAVMYENKERNKNYKFIGIELQEEYARISHARIEYARTNTLVDQEGEIKEAPEIKPTKKKATYKGFNL